MERTIITPKKAHIELDIPEKYVGKKIEITYSEVDEMDRSSKRKTMADFWGILSDETAKELHAHVNKSRNEWERDI
jgi:hypothetical protein